MVGKQRKSRSHCSLIHKLLFSPTIPKLSYTRILNSASIEQPEPWVLLWKENDVQWNHLLQLAHADQHHYALMDYICSPLSSQLSRGKNERGKKKHDANFPTLTLFDTHAEQKQTGQQIGNCKLEFVAISFFATTEELIHSRGKQ